ncbi:hypothetical protein [Collinsella sp. HCP28S3_E9]|uniref:hypothetical protein n=2 Tax=unclassified Collinsella TaxID=2637548 RepID=UPI002A9FDBC3|nr:hypothetical protein [Collinsella sp.]MDD6443139.1 hypothetical protein [Collinsella sp.]MDY5424816.1 hypothetical protein [Collinsella sp.]
MLPLNYAMLDYFVCHDEACVDDVMADLAAEYASFAAFARPRMQEALMTAHKNGLIDEARFDLDAEGELRVYYRASAEQRKVIGAYLGRSH